MKEPAMLKVQLGIHAKGTRTTSPRQSQVDNTPLIFMDVSSCPLSRMPPRVSLGDHTYEFFCITYQAGDHHVGCVSIGNKGWHLYNGLEPYHDLGTGVKKQLMPHPPPGYRQSYTVFVREP